jgi:hypothetical protein
VVALLIPWAAYSPNAGQEGVSDSSSGLPTASAGLDTAELERLKIEGRFKVKKGKTLAEQMGSRGTEVIYPAAEALATLTGQSHPSTVEAWKTWWQTARDNFILLTPDLPRRRQAPSLRNHPLFSGSLRDDMLRR